MSERMMMANSAVALSGAATMRTTPRVSASPFSPSALAMKAISRS
jgi:hypothetical protein